MTTNAIIIPAPKPVNPVAITLPVRTTTIANSKMQLNMIFNIVTIAPTKRDTIPTKVTPVAILACPTKVPMRLADNRCTEFFIGFPQKAR